MAENVRPPVAIRIVRPYQSDDDFLTNELETVGKTSIILIGAHPRPPGVILRFEVTLASGVTVLRGEGRVLGHKESAFRGQPGLSLRFTRLDPKSKALVDRAAAMREARLTGELPPLPVAVSSAPPAAPSPPAEPIEPIEHPAVPSGAPVTRASSGAGPLADALTAPTPPPAEAAPPSLDDMPTHVETRSDPGPLDVPEPLPSAAPAPPAPPAPAPPAPPPIRASLPGEPRRIEAPPERNALLSRLRERASTLSPDRVRAILAARPK